MSYTVARAVLLGLIAVRQDSGHREQEQEGEGGLFLSFVTWLIVTAHQQTKKLWTSRNQSGRVV